MRILRIVPDQPPDTEILQNLNAVEAAEDRAYKRGATAGKFDAKLDEHFRDDDRRFAEIKRHGEVMATRLDALTETVEFVKQAFGRKEAVDADRAAQATTLAQKQLSTREFYIGLATAVITLGGILLSTGHI